VSTQSVKLFFTSGPGTQLNLIPGTGLIFFIKASVLTSVADPDPIGSGLFRSDPDPDVWDRIRIRILALINDSVSTFLVCVKAINT
jgi:hypothetical protein